ncbi:hypothetical protein TrRE_jg7389 [Triparma retinervis]|uniref:Uncharacterized protein n=1 Tax=Triparma retinervis TaxID=2557542 RepID=A0A9W6ZEA3_9STRA|nr:hypothetical protein TrRE_jg7389 [Triparma retinervis]
MCKTHYEIHLLDVSERRRNHSGFEGKCAAPRCKLQMFKAGLCKAHYHEHKRNLVDHGRKGGIGDAGREKDAEPEKPTFSREMILLRAKAKKEESRRRKDAEAADAFRIAQEERRAALERIKARQEGEDLVGNWNMEEKMKQLELENKALAENLNRVKENENMARLENKVLVEDLNKVKADERELQERMENLMNNIRAAEEEKERLYMENLENERARRAIEDAVQVAEERAVVAERLKEAMEKDAKASDAERERLRSEAERLRAAADDSKSNAEHDMVVIMEKNVLLENELTIQMERVEQENYNLKIAEALAKVEAEKNERLRLEGEERRRAMELEMLKGKNKGRERKGNGGLW